MDWRVLAYQVSDPAWNMAVDEAIFTNYLNGESPPTLRFYGWAPATVSIGYFQAVDREIDTDNLDSKGYGLVRRNTGGRAVLHDQELTYSVISGVKDGLPGNLKDSYLYISRVFVDALQVFNVDVELDQGADKRGFTGACFDAPSWCELTVKGRKLVGSAQYRQKGSFLQHGSILLQFSALDLESVLKIPDGLRGSYAEKLRAKVCSLEELGVIMGPTELASQIIESFGRLYGITFKTEGLTVKEAKLAETLAQHKYSSVEWNFKRGSTRDESRLYGIQTKNR